MQMIRNVLILLAIALYPNVVKSQITGIKIAGDTCNSFTLGLQALGTSSSPYFFWNFGDPSSGINDTITITGTSPSPFPTHTFSGPGVYNVCVSFKEPGDPEKTICRTISIGLCCNGVIKSLDSCFNSNTRFSILTSASITSVSWNFGDVASGTANISTLLSPTHVFSAIGNYNVTANVTASCGTFNISYPITIVSCTPGQPCLGAISMRDSCVQNGSRFTLNSPFAINSVSWSFGDPNSGSANISNSSSPIHYFTNVGRYIVRATAVAECGTIDTSYTADIIRCDTSCNANIVYTDSCARSESKFRIITNSTINSISWDFGDPSSGTANNILTITEPAVHSFSNSGIFRITATVNLACSSFVVTKDISVINCLTEQKGCSIILPSGFTPNKDGLNDVFYARSQDVKTIKTFRIYNRWGELVFTKQNILPNDQSSGWDGQFKSQACSPGVYMYYLIGVCASGKEILFKGDVTIVR